MSKSAIVTITSPAELLLAQLSEVRAGNTATREEIERLQRLLAGGQRGEARLEVKLNKLLEKHRQKSSTVSATTGTGD